MLFPILLVVGAVGVVVLALKGKTILEAIPGFTESWTIPPAVPADGSGDNGNIGSTNVADWKANGITTDPATWPAGDRIWDICRAIAKAEGYDIASSAPFRLNNPGDLSDGASTYGSEFHSGSNITKFPDAMTGWTWLYNKIKNHVEGKSSVYPANWSISQFAAKYAANWQNWKNNVGRELGVNPDSVSFAEYVA